MLMCWVEVCGCCCSCVIVLLDDVEKMEALSGLFVCWSVVNSLSLA